MGNTIQKQKQSIRQFNKKRLVFTCEICYESRNKKFNHKWKSHPICLECMEKYIQTKIDENYSKIKCPHPKCSKFLNPISFRSIIPINLSYRWFELIHRDEIIRFDRAYCPFSDCSVLVLNKCRNKIGKINCPKCKREFCFKCQVPCNLCCKCDDEREGLQDENDDLFRQLAIAQKWTRCPACYHVIERISGCSEVRCRCGTNFCYKCGGWLTDHHDGSCPRSQCH